MLESDGFFFLFSFSLHFPPSPPSALTTGADLARPAAQVWRRALHRRGQGTHLPNQIAVRLSVLGREHNEGLRHWKCVSIMRRFMFHVFRTPWRHFQMPLPSWRAQFYPLGSFRSHFSLRPTVTVREKARLVFAFLNDNDMIRKARAEAKKHVVRIQ